MKKLMLIPAILFGMSFLTLSACGTCGCDSQVSKYEKRVDSSKNGDCKSKCKKKCDKKSKCKKAKSDCDKKKIKKKRKNVIGKRKIVSQNIKKDMIKKQKIVKKVSVR